MKIQMSVLEKKYDFPKINRESISILQVNLGYVCNQTCEHCHVNASPYRTEMMTIDNIMRIPDVINKYDIKCLDLTGGAPELNPYFKRLVEMVRELNDDIEIIDRCNLTILLEPHNEKLAYFLAEHKVRVVASLPCYQQANVDSQRGEGVFEKSIKGLMQLNQLGYGRSQSLKLDLVYNPIGPNLPPNQRLLEQKYKKELRELYNIEFNSLLTITNMPINRFENELLKINKLEDYYHKLITNYNEKNLDSVMCRTLISIDWEGRLYDCDFNQQLGIEKVGIIKTLQDMIEYNHDFNGDEIRVNRHCYGCTAGSGSSCGGSLVEQ